MFAKDMSQKIFRIRKKAILSTTDFCLKKLSLRQLVFGKKIPKEYVKKPLYSGVTVYKL